MEEKNEGLITNKASERNRLNSQRVNRPTAKNKTTSNTTWSFGNFKSCELH